MAVAVPALPVVFSPATLDVWLFAAIEVLPSVIGKPEPLAKELGRTA
jgi:hypothetical protein